MDDLRHTAGALGVGARQLLHARRLHSSSPRHRDRDRSDPHHPGTATDLSAARIDAVIFDMDGVLADSEPLHQHVIRVMLAEYGVDWDITHGDPTVGLRSLDGFEVIRARHRLPHDARRLDALYTARVLPVLR